MSCSLKTDLDRDQRLIAMGQMAASLAHEIRNPLGSMELFCTLLKKDLTAQPNLLQLAEQIHTGISTINHIITNCLQFSKQVNVNKKPVSSIKGFLQDSLNALSAKTAQVDVTIEVDEQKQGSVKFDHYLMKQVVINLVANAIDAAQERAQKENGHQAKVRLVSEFCSGDNWNLHVVDNGQGMSAEVREHVFEPFFSTKNAGTGLGLAIVHNLVVAHGGKININRNNQGGCTLSVSIPLSNGE